MKLKFPPDLKCLSILLLFYFLQMLLRHDLQRNVKSLFQYQLDLDIGEDMVCIGGPKTWVAGWHCHPESFCASGKFLRVTLKIARGSLRTLWKISRQSGYFPDFPESFQLAWKVSRQAVYFPDRLDIVRMIRKVSGLPGKFPNSLEGFWIGGIFTG